MINWCESKQCWCGEYICKRNDCIKDGMSKDEVIQELREALEQANRKAEKWELDAKRYCAELGEEKIAEATLKGGASS